MMGRGPLQRGPTSGTPRRVRARHPGRRAVDRRPRADRRRLDRRAGPARRRDRLAVPAPVRQPQRVRRPARRRARRVDRDHAGPPAVHEPPGLRPRHQRARDPVRGRGPGHGPAGRLHAVDRRPARRDPRGPSPDRVRRGRGRPRRDLRPAVRLRPRPGPPRHRRASGSWPAAPRGERLVAVLDGDDWRAMPGGGARARLRVKAGERRWMVLSWDAVRPEPLPPYRSVRAPAHDPPPLARVGQPAPVRRPVAPRGRCARPCASSS